MIKKSLNISDNTNSKVKDLKEYTGFKSFTSIVEYCINYTYQKELNNYINLNKNKTPKGSVSPEDRAENYARKYQDTREALIRTRREKGLAIAEMLNAEITTDSSGNEYARWNVYQKETDFYVSTGKLGESIMDLKDEYIETQFRGGTKEEILAILEKQDK